ncbi:MAG: TetR/AcrR family transcriptional regulator, partial [Spirochaetales bacterium]|nr:TetR/AcrR family transcriptional regulator [Spirochaetales bacterium]
MDAKEKLIDAAERCLLRKGCHGSSIKSIATEAGVNHGLIHHYFGSKEELFIEVLRKRCLSMFSLNKLSGFSENELRCVVTECLIKNSILLIKIRSMAFYMPELAEEMAILTKQMQTVLEEAFEIKEETATLMMASASGICFHAGINKNIDVEK